MNRCSSSSGQKDANCRRPSDYVRLQTLQGKNSMFQHQRIYLPEVNRPSADLYGEQYLFSSYPFQSSYLSQISQIIIVEKKLSCGEILGNFGEILGNFGKFCHNLRAFKWRKIEPKSTFVEKKLQISGLLTREQQCNVR